MGERVKCFWVEPTASAKRGLRVYDGRNGCPVGEYGYHQAVVPIEDGSADVPSPSATGQPPFGWRDDPRWPSACACGHAFRVGDEQVVWQVWHDRIYRRVDTGEERAMRDLAVGAMWDATWYPEAWRGADGISLVVKTPGGEWPVDALSTGSGQPWTRSGDPRSGAVTASPSIGIGKNADGSWRYHGWLRDGWLEAC